MAKRRRDEALQVYVSVDTPWIGRRVAIKPQLLRLERKARSLPMDIVLVRQSCEFGQVHRKRDQLVEVETIPLMKSSHSSALDKTLE